MSESYDKPFLIAIDSDGCAFDGLNLKQRQAFIPLAIQTFGLEGDAALYFAAAEEVNLFSHRRGCNRFEALYYSLLLTQQRATKPLNLPDLEPLETFVFGQATLSHSSLEKAIAAHAAPVLLKALQWSHACNERIASLSGQIEPFPAVAPFLRAAAAKANLMICSAATRGALMDEWSRAGFLTHVTHIAGQEFGPKDQQIRRAITAGCYDSTRVLMIGDALGDYRAAQKADVAFFPIVPNNEAESWRTAREEVLPQFLTGQYGQPSASHHLKVLTDMLAPCAV